MIANKKVQLRFPNDKGEQMQEITINIRQNQKYRDLVGLTCFQYIKCYDHPEFKGPKLEHSEVTDRSHSIYFVENGNIEPDVTIHIAQDLKSAAFDLKSLAEEKINGRMTMANIGLAIVENCISERAKGKYFAIAVLKTIFPYFSVGKTRVILSEIQMNRPTCQDVIVPIDTESTAEYVLLTAKSTFDEHGLQKLRPDQSFVLRKDNVILAPSIAILEFLQHNYRNPQIPDPVYTINLCIQTVEPPPKPPMFTEEQCSFAVKIIPSVMQSFKLGKKLQIAQDFTITFGNDCITIATGKPKATFKNRMTPTKLFAGIPSVIPYNKMSDFTIMPQKNERIQLTVAYKSDAAFERLVIRAPSDIGQRMHHFFEKNGVPHQSTSPSLASSRQKGRRKSVFF
jgi:hypothetical protein